MEIPDLSAAIVQTVREPLLLLDADLRVVITNRSFHRSFVVSPEQTVGKLIYQLGDGQWAIPALRKLLEEILPTDGSFEDYAVEHDFPGIGRRTMLLNARRLHDGDDNTKLILLAFEDVTERRRMEMELGRQRQAFETTLSSIGDAVIATDADAQVTYLNPTAERMTGWSAIEAQGKPLHEIFNIVNEETRNLVESPVAKAIRMGAIVGLANHTILIAKDGTERPIDDSAAPIRAADGGIMGVVMVFHDITERRLAEEALEVSEVRYRRLFEAAHDGILILNAETQKVIDVNRFMIDLLRFPREHFLGKELWELGILNDKVSSKTALSQLKKDGSVRYENLPLQDRDGRRVPVEFVCNIYQEDHTPVIQCNIRDVRERQRFADEREAHLHNEQLLRMEAETANRAKDMFLATLSHEMRTPLNAIVGWMSILRSDGCNDKDLAEGLIVIERNTAAQVQLIEDVLDVSRIVSGKMRLELRPCELAGAIQAGVEVLRPAATAKDITLDVRLDPAASPSTCDSARIQQVVWNLVSNAVKFTPKGGTVRVTLDREGSSIRIAVSDTGQGMDAELLPFVFDRFRQADSSTRRRFGGLGLGLSIVKHLVELHGGTVEAASGGTGKGSTITIRLPVRAVRLDEDPDEADLPAKQAAANAPAQPVVRLDGLTILIVDDDADARRLLGKVLEGVGATVISANGAAEALEALLSTRPDVIVSDLGMPDTDGFDLIRKVRRLGHNAKELPAVALSAFVHREDQRQAMLAGFQVHVSKPVEPNDLTAIIASLAGRTGTL